MGANEVQGRIDRVYGMMQQAHSNYTFIYSAVRDINTKLALVSETPDCPICTEAMGGASGREAKILQCCHKVCKECWDEWSEVSSHQGHGTSLPRVQKSRVSRRYSVRCGAAALSIFSRHFSLGRLILCKLAPQKILLLSVSKSAPKNFRGLIFTNQ